MAVQTNAMKQILADAYKAAATHAALYSTAPGSSAGTELAGGSPAYARKATAWSAAPAGATSTGPHVFDVASGATVAGCGLHSAVTAGTYYDGAALTSQPFSSQGTYSLTLTYSQT